MITHTHLQCALLSGQRKELQTRYVKPQKRKKAHLYHRETGQYVLCRDSEPHSCAMLTLNR